MPKAKRTSNRIGVKRVRIKRVNPDNVRSVPVNDLVVNHSATEFFVTFSSLEPPTVLDPIDLKEITGVDAITRSKITVSPDFVEAIIKALTDNLDKFKKEKKKK